MCTGKNVCGMGKGDRLSLKSGFGELLGTRRNVMSLSLRSEMHAHHGDLGAHGKTETIAEMPLRFLISTLFSMPVCHR